MALFKKGQPKPVNSGRKPGTPNKKTLLKASVFLAERDFHPVDKLIELLPSLSPRDQANVLLELLQYLEPKKKEQEIKEEDEEVPATDVSTEELLNVIK